MQYDVSLDTSRKNALSIEYLAEYGVWKDYDLQARSFSLIFELLNGHSNEFGFIAPPSLPVSPIEKVPLYSGINAACERTL